MKKNLPSSSLRLAAMIVLICGAAGSLGMTLCTGRNNTSSVLAFLFIIWVLSPFIGLSIASSVTRRRTFDIYRAIYWLMITIPVLSLIFYSGVININSKKPAFTFLIFPLISWVLIITVIPVASSVSKRRSRRYDND